MSVLGWTGKWFTRALGRSKPWGEARTREMRRGEARRGEAGSGLGRTSGRGGGGGFFCLVLFCSLFLFLLLLLPLLIILLYYMCLPIKSFDMQKGEREYVGDRLWLYFRMVLYPICCMYLGTVTSCALASLRGCCCCKAASPSPSSSRRSSPGGPAAGQVQLQHQHQRELTQARPQLGRRVPKRQWHCSSYCAGALLCCSDDMPSIHPPKHPYGACDGHFKD